MHPTAVRFVSLSKRDLRFPCTDYLKRDCLRITLLILALLLLDNSAKESRRPISLKRTNTPRNTRDWSITQFARMRVDEIPDPTAVAFCNVLIKNGHEQR